MTPVPPNCPPPRGTCRGVGWYDYVQIDNDVPSDPNSHLECYCVTGGVEADYFDCNDGYEWNGTACQLITPPSNPICRNGDYLFFLIELNRQLEKQKRRRQVIASFI
jgi:hypothetical protein